MSQTTLLSNYHLNGFLNRRWLVIMLGLAVQGAVIVLLFLSLQQPGQPEVVLSPVAGNSALCQVTSINAFTDAWGYGLHLGTIVHVFNSGSPSVDCDASTRILRVQIVGQHTFLTFNPPPRSIDLTNILLTSILAIIFSLTGSAILLRAQERPTARIAYALFYTTSLLFLLLNVRDFNYPWVNVLLFLLTMIARGLSTTFVCLFPYPLSARSERKRVPVLPYLPLGAGIFLDLFSLIFLPLFPASRFVVLAVDLSYNIICLIIVVWILFWGLRHLTSNEQQLARMIVVGMVFLLLPLALSLYIVRTDALMQESLARLLLIPLAILPIACDYAMFRHQLLGVTSLFSRRVMRVLLWLLLASLFIFPGIILWHFLASMGVLQGAIHDYLFAVILVLSLWLFPLAWNKVRDAGDQVFYRDFYQYNRSLSELSAALTRLQGLNQISTFVLPRLTTLLNATDAALLVRTQHKRSEILNSGSDDDGFQPWRVYCHPSPERDISYERLVSIANLALTHLPHASYDPLVLDGVLLLPLYDGDRLSGFLALGPKSNLEPYSRQDTSFLTTLASQLSVLEVNSRYLQQAQTDAQKLAALNHRVVSAQEDERKHLALELHDEALQQAMLLVRHLSDASSMTDMAEVMPLARTVVASLRRTCLELRPPLLDELGLEEAFYGLAHQTEQLSGGAIQVLVSSLGFRQARPPADVELALYRVCQEALSNVVKYSGATCAKIRLRRTASGDILLLITDNGRGFKKKHPLSESLGLVGMHERMAAIGGHLQIRTSPGRGVTIRATYIEAHRKGDKQLTSDIEQARDNTSMPDIFPLWEEALH